NQSAVVPETQHLTSSSASSSIGIIVSDTHASSSSSGAGGGVTRSAENKTPAAVSGTRRSPSSGRIIAKIGQQSEQPPIVEQAANSGDAGAGPAVGIDGEQLNSGDAGEGPAVRHTHVDKKVQQEVLGSENELHDVAVDKNIEVVGIEGVADAGASKNSGQQVVDLCGPDDDQGQVDLFPSYNDRPADGLAPPSSGKKGKCIKEGSHKTGSPKNDGEQRDEFGGQETSAVAGAKATSGAGPRIGHKRLPWAKTDQQGQDAGREALTLRCAAYRGKVPAAPIILPRRGTRESVLGGGAPPSSGLGGAASSFVVGQASGVGAASSSSGAGCVASSSSVPGARGAASSSSVLGARGAASSPSVLGARGAASSPSSAGPGRNQSRIFNPFASFGISSGTLESAARLKACHAALDEIDWSGPLYEPESVFQPTFSVNRQQPPNGDVAASPEHRLPKSQDLEAERRLADEQWAESQHHETIYADLQHQPAIMTTTDDDLAPPVGSGGGSGRVDLQLGVGSSGGLLSSAYAAPQQRVAAAGHDHHVDHLEDYDMDLRSSKNGSPAGNQGAADAEDDLLGGHADHARRGAVLVHERKRRRRRRRGADKLELRERGDLFDDDPRGEVRRFPRGEGYWESENLEDPIEMVDSSNEEDSFCEDIQDRKAGPRNNVLLHEPDPHDYWGQQIKRNHERQREQREAAEREAAELEKAAVAKASSRNVETGSGTAAKGSRFSKVSSSVGGFFSAGLGGLLEKGPRLAAIEEEEGEGADEGSLQLVGGRPRQLMHGHLQQGATSQKPGVSSQHSPEGVRSLQASNVATKQKLLSSSAFARNPMGPVVGDAGFAMPSTLSQEPSSGSLFRGLSPLGQGSAHNMSGVFAFSHSQGASNSQPLVQHVVASLASQGKASQPGQQGSREKQVL
ncbi:unnamed protein product, partial [Amoebophrya sp. A25]